MYFFLYFCPAKEGPVTCCRVQEHVTTIWNYSLINGNFTTISIVQDRADGERDRADCERDRAECERKATSFTIFRGVRSNFPP